MYIIYAACVVRRYSDLVERRRWWKKRERRLRFGHVADAAAGVADCHARLQVVDHVADEGDEDEEDEDDEEDDDVALHGWRICLFVWGIGRGSVLRCAGVDTSNGVVELVVGLVYSGVGGRDDDVLLLVSKVFSSGNVDVNIPFLSLRNNSLLAL